MDSCVCNLKITGKNMRVGKWAGDGPGTGSSSCCPLGAGPGALRGTGTPQHLPEVVWPPLPLVLRISRALRFQNAFLDPRPTGHAAAGPPSPDVPVVPESPLRYWGDASPPFRCPPDPQGGREGRGRGAQVSPPWQGAVEVGLKEEGRGRRGPAGAQPMVRPKPHWNLFFR